MMGREIDSSRNDEGVAKWVENCGGRGVAGASFSREDDKLDRWGGGHPPGDDEDDGCSSPPRLRSAKRRRRGGVGVDVAFHVDEETRGWLLRMKLIQKNFLCFCFICCHLEYHHLCGIDSSKAHHPFLSLTVSGCPVSRFFSPILPPPVEFSCLSGRFCHVAGRGKKWKFEKAKVAPARP